MPSLENFLLFVVASVLLVLTPGPNLLYLISRTLGLGFGGSIGIVLFLAQSVSIGFYCVGFGEAIAALGVPWDLRHEYFPGARRVRRPVTEEVRTA